MAEVLTQSQTTIDNDTLATIYPFNFGQGIKTATVDKISKFIVSLKYQVSLPAGTLTGYIYSDTGGVPDTALATFSTVAANTLTTSYAEYSFTGSFVPVIGTQYHTVVIWTGGSGAANITVGSNSAGGYTDGVASYAVGGAWVAYAGYDCYFKVYQTTSSGQVIIIE